VSEDLVRRGSAARAAHEVQKAVRQFANSTLLPFLHSFTGNKLAPDAQRNRSCQDEVGGSLLIYASCGDQRNLGKGTFQGPDVTIAADLCTRKNLYEIRSRLIRSDDFRGSEGAGHHGQVSGGGEFDDAEIEARTRQKLRARLGAEARRFYIQDRSRADNDMRKIFDEVGNYLYGAGNGHSYFDNRNAAAGDDFRGEKGVFGRRHAHSGDNSDFVNLGADLMLFQVALWRAARKREHESGLNFRARLCGLPPADGILYNVRIKLVKSNA